MDAVLERSTFDRECESDVGSTGAWLAAGRRLVSRRLRWPCGTRPRRGVGGVLFGLTLEDLERVGGVADLGLRSGGARTVQIRIVRAGRIGRRRSVLRSDGDAAVGVAGGADAAVLAGIADGLVGELAGAFAQNDDEVGVDGTDDGGEAP